MSITVEQIYKQFPGFKDAGMKKLVNLIVDYINIVESVTCADFNDKDWSVNYEQFAEI